MYFQSPLPIQTTRTSGRFRQMANVVVGFVCVCVLVSAFVVTECKSWNVMFTYGSTKDILVPNPTPRPTISLAPSPSPTRAPSPRPTSSCGNRRVFWCGYVGQTTALFARNVLHDCAAYPGTNDPMSGNANDICIVNGNGGGGCPNNIGCAVHFL